MIIATAAVCLGMDALTFTAMSVAKPYVKRAFGDDTKLGVTSAHVMHAVHDAATARFAAAKRAYAVYQSTLKGV